MTSNRANFDDKLVNFYTGGHEKSRLSGQSLGGLIELLTMREALTTIPPKSTILDVGGGAGVHSAWLAEQGHTVTMIDPVPLHVEQAREIGTFEAQLGDARNLEFKKAAFDVVLLLGPLYHLASADDRALALSEAARVLRPGGSLFAAGLSRLASFIDSVMFNGGTSVTDDDLKLLATGEWINPGEGFPGGHFHTATELEGELTAAGFTDVTVVGLERSSHYEFAPADADLAQRAVALNRDIARATSAKLKAIADQLSPHLLAVGTRAGVVPQVSANHY